MGHQAGVHRQQRGWREPPREHTGVVAKALAILEAVSNNPQSTAISELATLLDMSKPTAHRIASTLEELGFLKRDGLSRKFIEGDRLVDMALGTLHVAAGRSARHAILQSLADATGETCNLGVMSGGTVVYVDRVETAWPLGLRFEPGARVPVHCTAIGKMLLSELPPRRREAYITSGKLRRYTEKTITEPDALRVELERIAKQGVSTDDQEFLSGVVCLAVPVCDRNGRACAALAISAAEARLTLDNALAFLPRLREAADKLTESLASPD
jgi:IclR family acetate operon transcriptional repressor